MVDDRGMAAWMRNVAGTAVPADLPRRAGEAFLDLHAMAERNAAQVERLSRLGRVPVARLPLADDDVHDIEGLAQLAAFLGGHLPG